MKLEKALELSEGLFNNSGFQVAVFYNGNWKSVDSKGGNGSPAIYNSRKEAETALARIQKLRPYSKFKIVTDNSQFKD